MYCYSYKILKEISKSPQGKKIVQDFETVYNQQYSNKELPPYRYSYIKSYYQDGNRARHEKIYLERRNRFRLLQVLAIADDGYLEPLEELLFEICNEFTWVWPAHNLQKETLTYDYNWIDLLAAETGFYLAETVYVLRDKLSADIKKRIYISLEEKIVKNFEKRTFNFDKTNGNWASVCACGIGLTYLYIFPERFPLIKARIFQIIDNYVSGLDEEGYCSEGIGYWFYGFGFFSVFMDVYVQLTGERPKVLNTKKVKNTLMYFERARMSEEVFLPFADGGAMDIVANPFYLYTIKNLFQDAFEMPSVSSVIPDKKVLGYRYLYGAGTYGTQKSSNKTNGSIFYENSQVFIYKNDSYSFAVKGGNNDELHNHNDVGAFQIVRKEKRLIADLGPGEYTYGYFNIHDESEEGKYGKKIFTCSSLSHSVPTVNGDTQKWGAKYQAKILSCTDDTFSIDMAKAYAQEMDFLKATYRTQKDCVKVFYECQGVQGKIAFRFVTVFKPKILNQEVSIEDMRITNDKNLLPTVEKVDYKTAKSEPATAYVLEYLVETEKAFDVEFTFSFE